MEIEEGAAVLCTFTLKPVSAQSSQDGALSCSSPTDTQLLALWSLLVSLWFCRSLLFLILCAVKIMVVVISIVEM